MGTRRVSFQQLGIEMNITKILKTILGAAVICTATVDEASADSMKTTYSGLGCVYTGEQVTNVRYPGGSAVNMAVWEHTFSCPLHAHQFVFGGKTHTFNRAVFHVTVDDEDENVNVRCLVSSCNADGTSCTSTPLIYTSGTGIQTIELQSSALILNADRRLTLSCIVPGRDAEPFSPISESRIISYVSEFYRSVRGGVLLPITLAR